jgi:hypothetical protein
MSLSIQYLRDEFKTHFEKWGNEASQKKSENEILFEIQQWGENIEKIVQERIRLLETDFNDYPLKGEYLRSVKEGFDDLERLLRNQKTFLDIAKGNNLTNILEQIKHHYCQYLIPLLNIMSKLENDYISIATQAILEKNKLLAEIETEIKSLKMEKDKIRKTFFDLNKKKKFIEIVKKIQNLEMHRKIIQLSIHHIKLNIYYFNHDRPKELQELKEKADQFRAELHTIEEGKTSWRT